MALSAFAASVFGAGFVSFSRRFSEKWNYANNFFQFAGYGEKNPSST
jgi:hypothetical protein